LNKLGKTIEDKSEISNGINILKKSEDSNYLTNGLVKDSKVDGFIDRFLVNYNQKESEYWKNRIEKGNLYFSNNKRRSLVD